MNIISMIIFQKLFSVQRECSLKYDKDSGEYKKCKELQQFSDQLFEEFLEQNKDLLEQYIQMLEEFENQKFLMHLYLIQEKISDEIDNYLPYDEQVRFLQEFFEVEKKIQGFEFQR